MNNKVKFLRGTSDEYAGAVKDDDTFYYTTDDEKFYVGSKEITGGGVTVDSKLSDTSINPVQNKVIKASLDDKADKTTATTTTDGLMSASDKTKLDNADNKYALKSKYGDTTINVGRKADSDIGGYSTAEGYNTIASGDVSHAEGHSTIASGYRSHAEGEGTIASGAFSHAGGYETTASGGSSHAEGEGTIASGAFSHAGGYDTKALKECEFAHGKYNVSNEDTLFSIGDGTAEDARHNAFEITTTGGKLHDKDIATIDDIPSSLPANGGNANTVGGKSADDFAQIIDFGYNQTDTKIATGKSGKTTIYRCNNWTDCPSEFIDGQGTLIAMNYTGEGTAGTDPFWCTQFIVNARAGNKIYVRYTDHVYVSDWKEISTTPIKSTGWITTPTNDIGDINLPEGDSRKYLSVCSVSSLAFLYHTGSTYIANIKDGNMAIVQSTPVTYIAFYID